MISKDDLQNRTHSPWVQTEIGTGHIESTGQALQLSIGNAANQQYSNAQISDYNYQSFQFRWRPPVRMSVTARASVAGDQLRGTAGFGFWNHPFSPDVRAHRWPRLPQAIWFFFGSPPNDMQLAYAVPGHGWKAAQIDAGRPQALGLIPLALPALLLLRIPTVYRHIYPKIQHALAIHEATLDNKLLAETHKYTIEWRADRATFFVDDQAVLKTTAAPRGPCGFIAWLDNQYAIVTPQGRFGAGVVPIERDQSLWLDQIVIESGI